MKKTALLISVYFTAPYLLFLLYLRSIWLIPGLVFVAGAVYISKGRLIKFKQVRISVSKEVLTVSLFAVLAFILLGGVPQFIGYEPFDWEKHNTILSDLVNNSWPVIYETGQSLNYYLGIYLVPAAVGKVIGSFESAKLALSIWNMTGFVLCAVLVWQWLRSHNSSQLRASASMLLMLLFSGMDWLVYLLDRGKLPPYRTHIEWSYTNLIDGVYTGFFQYGAPVTLFVFVPQHFYPALAGCILALRFPKLLVLLLPAMFIWSPFAVAGLCLVLVVLYYDRFINLVKSKTKLMAAGIILGGLLPTVYMLLHHSSVDRSVLVTNDFVGYLVFVAAELLLLLLIVAIAFRTLSKRRKIQIAVCIAVLMILPLFRIGTSGANDILIRSVLPVFIFVLLIGVTHLRLTSRVYLVAIACIWIMGLLTPIYEILRIHPGRELRSPAPSIIEIRGDETIHNQYLGTPWN